MEVQQAARIKLTDLIAPAFYKVHKDIKEGRHEYYNLYGGRGSGKSSFVSVELPLGMMQNPEANAAVFHKFSAMLRDSVYNQIQWGDRCAGRVRLLARQCKPDAIYLPANRAKDHL